MSKTIVERLEVAKNTKYGFQTVAGEFIGWSPKFKNQAAVFPGVVGEFTLYVSDGGKKYVNDVTKLDMAKKVETKPTAVLEEKKVDIKAKPSFKAKDDISMTKAEWSAKDRSQLIGGLSHDAATIAVSVINLGIADPNVSSALEVYQELLEGMIKIRDEVK